MHGFFPGKHRTPYDREREDPDGHYTVDLLPMERAALLDWLEDEKLPPIALRQYIAKKLKDAPRRDGPPLPVARLDWRRAEKAARARGESVPDWMWDGAPEPPEAA